MWYNPKITLSHNCLLNYVIGNRGGGKTYGSLKQAVNNKIKKSKSSIYLRRYKTELKNFNKQFNTLKNDKDFKNYMIGVKGLKAYVIKKTGNTKEDEKNLFKQENVFCYALPLSTSVSIKSTDFNDVTLIIFDEFIIEKSAIHYLPNEVDLLIGLMETVFRLRDEGNVLCLGNSVTMNNPHMNYWHITKVKKEFTKDKDNLVLLHVFKDDDYVKAKEQTKLGKLIRKSNVGDYMIDNDFINDSNPFIEEKSKNAKHLFNIVIYGNKLGVWVDYDVGKLWVSKKITSNEVLCYSLTVEDREPNRLFLKAHKRNYHMNLLKTSYSDSTMFYDTQEIFFICKDIYKILSI